MAHFARLNQAGQVLAVIKVDNACCLDANGDESEAAGIAFCKQLYGEDTVWLQTSINKRIRKNFATVGGAYDPQLDAFLRQKPFPSWRLDFATCDWEAPVPRPNTEQWVTWVEPLQRWLTGPDLEGIDANAPDSIYHEAHADGNKPQNGDDQPIHES